MEILYILMGLVLIYTGLRNAFDKSNPHRFGSAFFWTVLGVVIDAGRWISPTLQRYLDFRDDDPSNHKKSE